MKTTIYSLLFIALTGLQSCENRLPKPTRTGEYTFGCKINGKKWIPDGGKGFMPAKPIDGGFLLIGRNDKRTIYITATSQDKRQVVLFIDEAKLGTIDLNNDTQPTPPALDPKSYGSFRSTGGIDYITSSHSTGQVTITRADTISGIISGYFYFTASSDKGDVVSITDGQFDYVRQR